MSISQICIEQHEKESKAVKKFLVYCFAASILTHILGIISLPYLFKEKEFVEADEPIEIVVIDELEEEKLPTPEPIVKPEEIPLPEQPQPVPQISQDTQTTLIEPPEQATIESPDIEPERQTIEPVVKPPEKSLDIKPEIEKEVESENKENTPTESPEKPIEEPSKPEKEIPTDKIADNTDNSPPVMSGDSPSELKSPSEDTSANSENSDSTGNNQENNNLKTPINSKPINEGSGSSSENPKVIPDRGNTNSGSTENSPRRKRIIRKPKPPEPKPKPKPTAGGGKCIRNCGLPNANSYIKRNFDGRERTVSIIVTFNDKGKVTNVQISPSTGNSSYDRVLRRDARRLRFSKGKAGTQTYRFNIVESGSKKSREAKERQRTSCTYPDKPLKDKQRV